MKGQQRCARGAAADIKSAAESPETLPKQGEYVVQHHLKLCVAASSEPEPGPGRSGPWKRTSAGTFPSDLTVNQLFTSSVADEAGRRVFSPWRTGFIMIPTVVYSECVIRSDKNRNAFLMMRK